jgi:hypothetical protein
MSIDYRDITIKVDEQRSTVSVLYKGGGGLHLPYNKLTIEYPLDGVLREQQVFERKDVCDGR